MIHIPSTGCGWAVSGGTYTCGGLPKLDEVFQTTDVTGQTIEGTTITYDEFDRVPRHIEGFRMTLSPIIDMSGGTPSQLEVPELACRVDFDPFNELVAGTDPSYVYNIDNAALTGNTNTQYTGFLDLYNQVKTYKDNFYTVNGDTISGSTEYIGGNFPTYKDQEEMGPGILEPMINTDFGEIHVDMPPTPDLTVDAIIYSLVGLQGWRHAIDMRVNNLMVNAADTGMENLEAAKNMEGPCANLQIKVKNGYPFAPFDVFGSTNSVIPSYMVTQGNITINGFPVTIHGTTHSSYPADVQDGIEAPFYAYLEYWPLVTGTTITGYTGTIRNTQGPYSPTDPSHQTVEIGRVKAVSNITGTTISGTTISGSTALNTPFPAGSSYMLFEIEQGDCIEKIDTVNADGTGYLYQTVVTGGKQYKTDSLLNYNEFNAELSAANAIRGVQASAIQQYVAAHGSTASGEGRLYPDYVELSKGESSVLSGIGVGVTYVFPVKRDQHIGFRTEANAVANCFVKYAPALGETGTPFKLDEGKAAYDLQVADADGFVRFSILDDGKHQGQCVRFLDGNPDWEYALPVYRFGDFHVTTAYNGPFRVRITDRDTCTITIDCPVCDNDPNALAGHYWLDGINSSDVLLKTIDGSTQATTNIYAHVTGTTCIIDDTAVTGSTDAPPSYTVWLAHIDGKTHISPSQELPSGAWFGGTVTQIHHGDIYVDGRWQ